MAADILIVDDEADIRELIAGILQDEGFETRLAHNSDAALTEINQRRPSLIVLDIWLQGSKLDGLDLLMVIKEKHPDVPVIIISGHGNIETAVKSTKLGAFDLVFTGRESGDWGVGQTGALLAELLNVPYIGFVDSIESADGQSREKLRLKRQTDNGFEIIEATPPLVVSITNDEHNVPRIPKTRDVMMSVRTPITKFTLDELGVDAATIRAGGEYYEVAELGIPVKDINCEFVTGDSLEQKVEQLAQRILEVTRAL